MILYILFYSYFIVKPHEAQMFWCRGHLLRVKPPETQMLWCWGNLVLFIFSFRVENRTLSQMCGILYLAIFLLRVGLVTLMSVASFMALAIFCLSLPIILKLSMIVVWPMVFWWSNTGDSAFKCYLYHCSNVLTDSPMYSPSHSVLPHLNQYIMLLCLVIASLFGNISRLFRVLPFLKCTWTPYLPQMVL